MFLDSSFPQLPATWPQAEMRFGWWCALAVKVGLLPLWEMEPHTITQVPKRRFLWRIQNLVIQLVWTRIGVREGVYHDNSPTRETWTNPSLFIEDKKR